MVQYSKKHKKGIMKIRYLTVARICKAILLISQLCITTSALKKTSDIDEFTIENRRQNYFRKRTRDDEMPGSNGLSDVTYSTDYIDTEPNLELPSLIVDYANMIRNDIILLDNSEKTRSRKRGNLKFKRDDNEKETTLIDLGIEYFPRYIEKKFCASICLPSYRCQENLYNLTILRKKGSPDKEDEVVLHLEMPHDLRNHYVAVRKQVTTGCVCTSDFIDSTVDSLILNGHN